MSVDAVVVGGGLAGIAASVALSDAGLRVTLVETRKKLGGRATSFTDPRTGEELDNCQHVALGCCTNFRWLSERLGVDDRIAWWDRLWWCESGGRVSEVRATAGLGSPLHLAAGLLRASFLSAAEKVALGRAMLSAMRDDRERWGGETFASWLCARWQSDRLVDRFWTPLIVSACNGRVESVSARVGLHVVQEALLAARRSFEVGVPRVPLARVYEPAVRAIEEAGGSVLLGEGAGAVSERCVRLRSGEAVRGERVVLAVPFERAGSLLHAGGVLDERVRAFEALEHSPILGVHLVFDRPVLSMPHAVLLGDSTPWVFRKDEEGRRVHAVVSAADGWVDLDEAAIVERVLRVMDACLPGGLGDAAVESSRSVKERRATFLPSVEAERRRVAAERAGGVVLAGCYTDTGWPSTMEGAVRSGLRAAEVVLGRECGSLVRKPVRPDAIVRWFGGASLRRQRDAAGITCG